MLQKIVWAGANNHSYPLAAEALAQLGEVRLSTKQVRRMVTQVGQARLTERDEAVRRQKAMPLAKRRAGSQASPPPTLAVISMDGGRYQRRDNFRNQPMREATGTHWREDKVGCLLAMDSQEQACDPAPEFPQWLAQSEAVAELAKIGGKTGTDATPPAPEEPLLVGPKELDYEPPKLRSREILASGAHAEEFGWQLEARAWQLGFPAAARQAFVADGQGVNWTIQQKHFPHATPILDLMHALSYAWSAAAAVPNQALYRQWAEWIWKGEVARVIAALAELKMHVARAEGSSETALPSQPLEAAWTYYTNNQSRMNYPQYRRQGLPLTSSHIESAIKQINHRVKGTEKFWRRDSGEVVLQLRADCLSDSKPLAAFWQRWQTQQTGSNRYQATAA